MSKIKKISKSNTVSYISTISYQTETVRICILWNHLPMKTLINEIEEQENKKQRKGQN